MSNRDSQRRALEIFTEAIELTSPEREVFIRTKCAGDAPLLQRVEKMLAVDADPQVIATEFANVRMPETAEAAPEYVGPYRITGELGRGGMGVVYRAERDDGRFDRTVAVKFFGSAWLADEFLLRFENERRIAARLEHPNIARLLDGGEVNGRPYIVMEYVEGETLKYNPGRPLPVLVAMFIKVCEALDYAHNNLVLHRDIKPGNVIVTSEGEPKLLDFGIAKLEEASLDEADQLTQVNQLPMTPAYTSPECLAGSPATVRSEVYSLGVALYELTHGALPFDLSGANAVQAHERVTQNQSRAIKSGSDDLDVIIGTAMHKDEARRYPSVAALAADLSAMLTKQPIAARADDFSYVLGRYIARHKATFVTGVVGLVGLVVAFVVALNLYFDAEQARLEAQRQASNAESAVVFLSNTLEGANPLIGLSGTSSIDEALALAESRLEDDFAGAPENYAYLLSRLAGIHVGRGDVERAMQSVEASRRVVREQLDNDPRAVALNSAEWISAAIAASNLDDALLWANEGIEAFAQVPSLGPDIESSLYFQRGEVLRWRSDNNAALEDFYRTIEIGGQLEGLQRVRIASAHNSIALLHSLSLGYEDAERHLFQSYQILKELGRDNTPNALRLKVNRANVMALQGRWAQAKPVFREAIDAMEQHLGSTHEYTLNSIANFGLFHQRMGEGLEGIAMMQRYLDVAERSDVFGSHHYPLAHLRAKLGFSQCTHGQHQEGADQLQLALETYRQTFEPGNWQIADVQGGLGVCYTQLGRFEEAGAHLQNALSIYLKTFGPEHPNTESVRRWIADLESAQQQM